MKTYNVLLAVLMISVVVNVSMSGGSGKQPPNPPYEQFGSLVAPFTPIVSQTTDGRPDICVHPSANNQIDLSIGKSSIDPTRILIGSYTAGLGVGYYYSTDAGGSWTGNDFLPEAGQNASYPTVSFDANGNAFYLYRQTTSSGDFVYWLKKSIDGGVTWLPKRGLIPELYPLYADMAIDATASSPYANNIYVGYTDFTTFPSSAVKARRSVDGGTTFNSPVDISSPVTSYYSRGVRFSIDCYGNLFAAWAIYDGNGSENALGFNYSTNGGASWAGAKRVIEISGIFGLWTNKNPQGVGIEVNSFPSIAVDKSGPYRGRVYAVWADRRNGDADIYFSSLNEHVSTNQGGSWDQPKRVNNDQLGNGKDQWMPWINVSDQGVISIVFYDSRNDATNQKTEVWVARSTDGGSSFANYLISDYAFTPYPVFSSGYMGTYMGITSTQGYTIPCWADNRPTASPNPYQAYVERFVAPPAPPQNVQQVAPQYQHPRITWSANSEPDIVGYNVYRSADAYPYFVKLNASLVTGTTLDDVTATVGGSQFAGHYVDYWVTAVNQISQESSSSPHVTVLIDGDQVIERPFVPSEEKPKTVAFHDVYPNPFNPSTQFEFDLPENSVISLNVFDVLGEKVGEIANGNYVAGYHSVTWNASNVSSGVYFARFTATDASGNVKLSKVSKLLLTK